MPIPYAALLKTHEVREAKRRRQCHHAKKQHIITRGTKLLIVVNQKEFGPVEEGFCQECAARMIDRARQQLLKIEEDLGLKRFSQ